MTPAERHAELQTLRLRWMDALIRVAVETTGTAAWTTAVGLEREAGGTYTRALTRPVHEDPAEEADPASW